MTASLPTSPTLPPLHDNPWLTRTVRIADVIDEAPGVATYRLTLDGDTDPAAYGFIPGQFNMLYLPGVGESAISMSGDPTRSGGWTHTVRVAGNVTRTLAGLKRGDTLGLRGPFGTGWPVDELAGGDVVIVAGGLGMAPLRPLIYHVMNHRDRFSRVTLICGARTPDGLLYRREYDNWRQHRIDVHETVDRATAGWTGQIGVVTTLIDRLRLPDPKQTQLIACGLERGIAPERMWLSLERNMQCATGLCGHCQLGPEFICKDGPVLRYDHIRPYLFVEQL